MPSKEWQFLFIGGIQSSFNKTDVNELRICITLQNTSVRHMDLPFDLTPYTSINGSGHRDFTIVKFEYDEINKISDDFFSDSFLFMRYIETFSFRGNKLKKIPDKFFQNFEYLVHLDLSQNQFENISDLAFVNGKFLH